MVKLDRADERTRGSRDELPSVTDEDEWFTDPAKVIEELLSSAASDWLPLDDVVWFSTGGHRSHEGEQRTIDVLVKPFERV